MKLPELRLVRRIRANALSWLLLACLLLSAAAIGWVVHSATVRTDEVAADHEERLAANGFELRKRDLDRTVMTETVWDDAVRNLDVRFDRAWAEANMVTFFTETSGYELVAVLDAQGRPVLSHMTGRDPAQVWPQIHGDVERMVASIRTREAGVRRSLYRAPSKTLVSKAIDVTTVVRISGAPYLLTAALVQPDFGTVLPNRRAPVVVIGEAIDGDFLKGLGAAYLLHDLHLVPSATAPRRGVSVLPIRNREGEIVARLAWAPDEPAADLLRHLSAPLGALVLILILLPVTLFYWERRRSGQLQQARDAAEAASVAKSQFLTNMSHEIRTPLNGVLGVAGALGQTELCAKQREMVDLISGSAKSLEALLSDILDLARVESGALAVQNEPFDLATSVKACGALFDAAAQAKGLDLHVSIDPAALGAYIGDAPRIRQVLSNLLSNAVKFTSQGRISLEVTWSNGEAGRDLVFQVSDTGIGFDAETASRLFSRFEQGDGSITRRFGGSGLGLAISRKLALAMGGELVARSAPGVGSVFTLQLPLQRCLGDIEPAVASAEAAAVTAVALRVLVAEDHPTNRRVVELILGAVGVELTSVEDGAQALDAFKRETFDLVLMDMQMPVMDGLTAIREIRLLEHSLGSPRTPVYVLTANAMPDHFAASMQAGADGHLSKPISPEKLLAVVSEVARSRAPAQPDRCAVTA